MFNDQSECEASGARFELGFWLCDFLSVKENECAEYIERFSFKKIEKASCVVAHRLFNIYLLKNYRTINEFERFVEDHNLLMLQDCVYEKDETGNTINVEIDDEYLILEVKPTVVSFQNFMAQHSLRLPQSSFQENSNGNIEEIFICDDLVEFCTVLLYNALRLNRSFNICQNCYNWFVPNNRSDEKYCKRPSPQYKNKNCGQAAKLLRTLERRSDEAIRLLKNLRQMFDNAGKDKTEFNGKVIEWRNQVYEGTKTKKEYIDWLKSQYKRKYK